VKNLIAAALLLGCGQLQAAMLIGETDLLGDGDLTVIEYNDGRLVEYLDLSETQGMTVGAALAVYGEYGFHFANENDVSQLFDAFGFTYSWTPGSLSEITDATAVEQQQFLDYLGGAIIGPFDEPRVSFGHFDNPTAMYDAYFCIAISTGGCDPQVFTNDLSLDGFAYAGITLVRTAVPIPAAVWLFGSGLGLLGWFRKIKA